jgi:hypothetical protein
MKGFINMEENNNLLLDKIAATFLDNFHFCVLEARFCPVEGSILKLFYPEN